MPKRAFASSTGSASDAPPGPEEQPAGAAGEPPAEVADRPPAATAAELTDHMIVRPRSDAPTVGWRRAVHAASGGVINLGAGPVERRRHDLAARIRRELPGPHQIAVTSIKGGVGKTTVTALLGLALAEHRGDRVVALDADPDAGTLADRLTGEPGTTVRDLLDHIEDVQALPDVARFTSLAGRLQVLASEQDAARSVAINRAEYEQVCTVLSRFYNIVVTDSGTGMMHSAMHGTLATTDSLVVVGALTLDSASRASKTLDWLLAHGHRDLVARAVVVLSGDRTSREVDTTRLRAHFSARCRAVVDIPHDPHLAVGGTIEMAALRPATADAVLELAALVADEFGQPGGPNSV
ncbi:MinD/ParA family ATP-binding protein [Pseudonocardia xinjiangensis]|uniref:MinD/ParA family ATP-binding protein n=1 Tax=Pseudonocardia xinjiangensis TaxID=75289 RepID=UPI003D8E7DF7